MGNKRKFFIISGEMSGDIHGSLLMKSMRYLEPNCSFIGIGGKKMQSEGLNSLFPLEKMSVMGFVEVFKHLLFFKGVEKKVLSVIGKEKPEQIILIDYPGFNLRIAQKIKCKFNIPVNYYISPQIWAWKEKRIKSIRKYIDQMLVIFPFEKKWYAERGIDVKWVGHPYLEEWGQIKKSELKLKLGINKNKPLLTLFPGSRKQELNNHLQLCINAAKQIQKKIADIQIILGLADNLDISSKEIPENIIIESSNPRRALEAADMAIVASGTSTLEATIYKTPMVIIYKMNIISWILSKILVKSKYAGMPNLIANKMIVPELLQSKLTADSISKEAIKIMESESRQKSILADLQTVKESLGDGKASLKAAKIILRKDQE